MCLAVLVLHISCACRNELVAKYQREIKQLNGRNRELLHQHESSEETLRDYHSRTQQLQIKLDE